MKNYYLPMGVDDPYHEAYEVYTPEALADDNFDRCLLQQLLRRPYGWHRVFAFAEEVPIMK